jgi:hypothetical protein
VADVEAAFGLTILPVSAPGAVAYAGPSFLFALERLQGRPILVDCGDRAGDVMASLRTGLRQVLFTGRPDVAERLAAMAAQRGGQLYRTVDLPLVHLRAQDDLRLACRRHLRAAP